MPPELGAGVECGREAAVERRASRASDNGAKRVEQLDPNGRAPRLEIGCGMQLRLAAGKAGEVDTVTRQQLPEGMERPDAVSLVRRPWHAMGDVEDVHCFSLGATSRRQGIVENLLAIWQSGAATVGLPPVADAESPAELFDVVVNHEGQYSIWPVGKPMPAKWHAVGVSGSKEECLAHIKAAWTDMRPLSVRRRHGDDDQ